MALKDLLALADDKLHEVFSSKPHDPSKARAPILKGIDRTAKQFAQTEPVRGRKWFKVANSVVELTLPFSISGKSTFYIPSERFPDFLEKLKSSVEAGELDKEIEAGAGATPPQARERKPRSDAGQGRNGWSEERRAKFAATVAARNAAKGK